MTGISGGGRVLYGDADREQRLSLLTQAALRLRKGGPLPRDIERALGEALADFLAGRRSVEESLGVAPRRGQSPVNQVVQRARLADLVRRVATACPDGSARAVTAVIHGQAVVPTPAIAEVETLRRSFPLPTERQVRRLLTAKSPISWSPETDLGE